MLGSIWIGLLVGISGTCYVLGVITIVRHFIKHLEKHVDKYIRENDHLSSMNYKSNGDKKL